MSDNIHSGHRQRLKNKFRRYGLDSFTDIEALELLLFYAIPRQNTNELAHVLLDRFGSFRGVLEAELPELEQVPGIGENAALLLRLMTAMNIRYLKSERGEGSRIGSSAEAGAFLLPYFEYLREECSLLVCLDVSSRVIRCHQIAKGGPSSVEIPMRDMVEYALQDKAARVILAHNHVSEVALPSAADTEATIRIYQLLKSINVELIDHIVVSGDDFVSMRDSGFFRQL